MSLATRCPACGTVFRVVQDQLKVSQGWVRCGQCHEVFNALEGLFELPPQPPVAPPPVPAHGFGPSIVDRSTFGATSAATQAVNTASATSAQAPMPQSSSVVFSDLDDDEAAQRAFEATEPAALDALAERPTRGERPDFTFTRSPSEREAAEALPPPPPPPVPPVATEPVSSFVAESPSALEDEARLLDTDALAAPFDASETPDSSFAPGRQRDPHLPRQPEFIRQAERAARWRHPAVRAVLASACGLLGLLLLGQLALYQRDVLAARWPSLRPALNAACQTLRCRVASPYALDQIVLDASHLSATDKPGVLRLDADLHNRAEHPVRTPALELSISSDSGSVLLRKVLLPAELGHGDTLEADGAWHLDLRLDIGELHVAGYTLEVFYP
ncbi:zinc-ribbon domain-containing protein [Ideonella azotifigens]|uniref:DUF3426 domain-containing protein n=2 Tax=Ideonella azotifigens TaxID=513160 RepID=A0ABP3VTX1_9BURK|nr:zinc-ribbon and DUF3426 domain-containing protein [Ideonella azotifigens]MCD2339558.1 zinc-ribbon domain-containing protein [Ideonella azotifigens]